MPLLESKLLVICDTDNLIDLIFVSINPNASSLLSPRATSSLIISFTDGYTFIF